MAMENQHNPEQIIENLGGCGRYQIRMVVITHAIKMAVCFGSLVSLVSVKTPPWRCDDDVFIGRNGSFNDSDPMFKSCVNTNNTACETFAFIGMSTIVSEFNLVCERSYIPGLIVSFQAIGMLIGNPLSGQLADLFGRKFPYFAGIFLIGAANLVACFPASWIMFAALKVFAGIGAGLFMTVQYNLMSEFTLAKWRAWIVNFPSWQIGSSTFALFGWLLNDWQYLHILTVGYCLVCLAAWWTIPESFRWYIAHDSYDDAKHVLEGVAKVNKRKLSQSVADIQVARKKKDRKYTFRDMFRTRYLVKISLLSALNWSFMGLVGYGLAFNIQALSGNVHLNIFLFSVTSMPIKLIASVLLNRIGRNRASMVCFGVTVLGGFVAAILVHVDVPNKGTWINVSAMVANMGCEGVWGTVQTMTVEVYPTVIRNIGFGTLSTVARIAGIMGPQLVLLDTLVPGMLFMVCGGLSLLCIIGLFFMPETMDANLLDKIQQTTEINDEAQNVPM